MNKPNFRSYVNYTNSNYGVHALVFTDNEGNRFYFSYETLVAFYSVKTHELYCIENLWGTTTGKHLNAIEPDKKKRLSSDEFEAKYKELFDK